MAKDAGSGYVTVACKLPHGFFLEIFDMMDSFENSPSGPRSVKVAVRKPIPGYEQHDGRIYINGTNTPQDYDGGASVFAGYGLTRHVPAEAWECWTKQRWDSDMLKNRLVFAYPEEKKVLDRARDEQKAGVKSGLETIRIGSDGNVNDPRTASALGISLRNKMRVTTADEQVHKPGNGRVRRDERNEEE